MERLILDGDARVLQHILTAPPEKIKLSSVAAEESIAGRLANIQRARGGKGPISVAQAHRDLLQTLNDLRGFDILAYSEDAERIFQGFDAKIRRVGSQDCRIAAQAIAENMMVVTRNLRDFEAIGVRCVDWSA